MARRSRDWNEGLSRDLRKPDFAREFVLGLLDEGFTLQQALNKVVRAYGVKEFASKAKMLSPNVLRSIDGRHNPTQKTLEHLLRPLGLRLTVEPTRRRRSSAA
jgi:DNA-binding phage protein